LTNNVPLTAFPFGMMLPLLTREVSGEEVKRTGEEKKGSFTKFVNKEVT